LLSCSEAISPPLDSAADGPADRQADLAGHEADGQHGHEVDHFNGARALGVAALEALRELADQRRVRPVQTIEQALRAHGRDEHAQPGVRARGIDDDHLADQRGIGLHALGDGHQVGASADPRARERGDALPEVRRQRPRLEDRQEQGETRGRTHDHAGGADEHHGHALATDAEDRPDVGAEQQPDHQRRQDDVADEVVHR
jgi:hypothetical protein